MSSLSQQQIEELRRLVGRTAMEDPLGKTIAGISAINVTPAIEEVLQIAMASSSKIEDIEAATVAAAVAEEEVPLRGDDGLTYPLSFGYTNERLDKITDALLESVVFLYDVDGFLETITHSKDATITTITWTDGLITGIAQVSI